MLCPTLPGGRSGVRTRIVAFSQRDRHWGFNALAGVRGFGRQRRSPHLRLSNAFQCPGGRSGVRTAARRCSVRPVDWFQCPGGRSGVRTPGSAPAPLRRWLRFNALAGVRGFGRSRPSPALAGRRPGFQCPGGRSGVRTDPVVVSASRTLSFNALAGVRGFGRRNGRPGWPGRPGFQCPGGRVGQALGPVTFRRNPDVTGDGPCHVWA